MALFGRRKSVVQVEITPADEQVEQREKERDRRRNRLSKPLTNSKISITASTTSLQDSVTKSRNHSATELVNTHELSSHPSNPDLRQQIRTEVFDSDRLSPQDALKSSSTLSVAQMVRQFDKDATSANASEDSLLPVDKPKKRKSLLLRRFSAQTSFNLSRSASKEKVKVTNLEAVVLSPSSSMDRMVDAPSIPTTRRASFTPGAATRKPSAVLSTEEMRLQQEAIEEVEERSVIELDYFDWRPRPPTMTGRAGTPADLSYSHLAGLKIGSLQVMNGRASPALSELTMVSKHLLTVPRQLRDVSSDYGDADDDDTHEVALITDRSLLVETPNAVKEARNFTWESVVADREETADVESEIDVRTKVPLDMDDDHASIMAKEYISELPQSPYSVARSSSLPGSLRRFRSDDSLQRSPSISSLQKTPPMTSLQRTPSMMSLQRSPSPENYQAKDATSPVSFRTVSSLSHTGSVVRRPSLRVAVVQPDPSADHDDHPAGSVMSWYSPVEPSFNQLEAFQSAVEFQTQSQLSRPQPQGNLDKSDSGYSSNNSLRSLRMSKVAPNIPQTLVEPPVVAQPSPAEPQTMSSDLRYRPSILKSRKTEPNVPTFANLRPAVIPLNVTPTSPSPIDPLTETSLKPVKQRKKLQKKRAQSQPPSKIAITRVRSFEAETIPAIPQDVRENLRIRTQEVPELEQTYARLNNQASLSTMFLPTHEVRFPSPEPERKPEVRRSRSISRPRSWISRPKEDNTRSRNISDLSQSDALAIINDFGTAASSLGNNPYHIAHESMIPNPPAPKHLHNKAPRPKSMMDDKSAAVVAKFRRRSYQQREAFSDRRPSFNDRGGIPGKPLRPGSFISDNPPITQEMLQTVYRTSSMQRGASLEDSLAPPAPSHSPPPPPPHSPRPAYVDYEEDYSDLVVAPPPPSHSPRPVDITPDPWAAQAASWRSRRQSIGLALKEQAGYSQGIEQAGHHVEEPLYPAIPPRNDPQRAGWAQYTTSPEEYFPSQNYAVQQYAPEYYPDHQEQYRGREQYQNATPSHGRYCEQFATYGDGTDRGRSVRPQNKVHRRPLPEPRNAQAQYQTRDHSQARSIRSQASSLAEELHPEHLEPPQPAPEFGRYSGGMDYGYERGNGFGGSAGTRSVSGKADGSRKGVPLRASYGVDLGDVPVSYMVRV
ncbi:hypothetical protein LTR84_004313 [Exophiala bonariae]|uniref:Uncharacterized protein n=1 Tax=Exophiala bonariae TaxID=1690606 RepID=A0AAV9N8I1_9EURO|nr:hypothetical protein LTR84_004313 [Exophiala bonariae]